MIPQKDNGITAKYIICITVFCFCESIMLTVTKEVMKPEVVESRNLSNSIMLIESVETRNKADGNSREWCELCEKSLCTIIKLIIMMMRG